MIDILLFILQLLGWAVYVLFGAYLIVRMIGGAISNSIIEHKKEIKEKGL